MFRMNLDKGFLSSFLLVGLFSTFILGCGSQEPASRQGVTSMPAKTKTGREILMEKKKQIEERKKEERVEEPDQKEWPVEQESPVLSLDDREEINKELERISQEVNKVLESELSWREKEAKRNELRAGLWEFCAEGPYEIEAGKAKRWIEEYIERPFREARRKQ